MRRVVTRLLSSRWARRGVGAQVGRQSLASGYGYDEGRWVTGPEEDRDRSGYCRMLRIDVFVDGLGVDVVEGRVRCI